MICLITNKRSFGELTWMDMAAVYRSNHKACDQARIPKGQARRCRGGCRPDYQTSVTAWFMNSRTSCQKEEQALLPIWVIHTHTFLYIYLFTHTYIQSPQARRQTDSRRHTHKGRADISNVDLEAVGQHTMLMLLTFTNCVCLWHLSVKASSSSIRHWALLSSAHVSLDGHDEGLMQKRKGMNKWK